MWGVEDHYRGLPGGVAVRGRRGKVEMGAGKREREEEGKKERRKGREKERKREEEETLSAAGETLNR